MRRLLSYLIIFVLALCSYNAQAQYFGQNKVRYKNLKFKVYQTPHFEIYYYMKNEELLKKFSQDAETWYKMHQEIFRDTFLKKNPLILYANHPDFQQTTALNGEIGVGTGGVTESLKNRIIMPVMELNSQTRHVLGHEMVHAFQYHLLLEKDSTNLENLGNLPLWMVEGMAEYLSIGKQDAFTSMWMRDAMLNRDIPSLKDLTTSNKYFPYRYGQAFWTFVGSLYGDTTIVPLFKSTAKYGYENAIRKTFGFDDRTLSSLWKNAIDAHYRPMLKTDSSQIKIAGKKLIDNVNGGNMNVAPAISPDGKYIAFLSEKDLFSIDLFLADAKTGKILRKLTSTLSNQHIDDFNFIESAGTWSPDGKKFAFSVFSRGHNELVIIDVRTGNTLMQKAMGIVEQFGNLTWSPDGNEIAFSGMTSGQSDIFSYNLNSGAVTQLTNDIYTDYAPNYSPDGKSIVFSTDRVSYAKSHGATYAYNLAILDLSTKNISNIDVFDGANNLNPQFSGDSKKIYFLSNRDGFRNLYRYDIAAQTTNQLTDYFTGISGITEYSPALSVSRNDDITYTYYRSQRYTIYNATPENFKSNKIGNQDINFDAAILPPAQSVGVDMVNSNLKNFQRFEKLSTDSIKNVPYKPKFKLDYLANSGGFGVSTSRFGTGLAGGIEGQFSDILGRNQISAVASINGEIYDFGAGVFYLNQEGRIGWGAGISHIPYMSALTSPVYETITGNDGKPLNVYNDRYDIIRTFEEQLQLAAFYPFSKVHRFEIGANVSQYSYRIDRFNNYYDVNYGYPLGYKKEKISPTDAEAAYARYGYKFQSYTAFGINGAFVGDNSVFGITAPLDGFRYRVGGSATYGTYQYFNLMADFRKYVRVKPVTFAARALTNLRLGKDSERFYGNYIGYPYFIRGYESSSYNNNGPASSGLGFDQLTGSRIAVANFEVRLPFTGPKKLTAIESKFLFTDLNAFFDIGLAWNSNSKVEFSSRPSIASTISVQDANGNITQIPVYSRIPVMSLGVSLRVNVFGYFVLEPYYAFPLQRSDIKGGVFGLTFAPGW